MRSHMIHRRVTTLQQMQTRKVYHLQISPESYKRKRKKKCNKSIKSNLEKNNNRKQESSKSSNILQSQVTLQEPRDGSFIGLFGRQKKSLASGGLACSSVVRGSSSQRQFIKIFWLRDLKSSQALMLNHLWPLSYIRVNGLGMIHMYICILSDISLSSDWNQIPELVQLKASCLRWYESSAKFYLWSMPLSHIQIIIWHGGHCIRKGFVSLLFRSQWESHSDSLFLFFHFHESHWQYVNCKNKVFIYFAILITSMLLFLLLYVFCDAVQLFLKVHRGKGIWLKEIQCARFENLGNKLLGWLIVGLP